MDPALLAQIAGAGIDGGGQTAQALRGASKSQIAQINSLQKQINSTAASAGNSVAGAVFDKQIAASQKVVATLVATNTAITKAMAAIAPTIGTAVDKALHGLTIKYDAAGIARIVRVGERALSRRA